MPSFEHEKSVSSFAARQKTEHGCASTSASLIRSWDHSCETWNVILFADIVLIYMQVVTKFDAETCELN